MRTRLGYADALLGGTSSAAVVHEGAELALREAITTGFYLGQAVSRPRLAKVSPPPSPGIAFAPRPRMTPSYVTPPWAHDHYGYGHYEAYGHHGHH